MNYKRVEEKHVNTSFNRRVLATKCSLFLLNNDHSGELHRDIGRSLLCYILSLLMDGYH